MITDLEKLEEYVSKKRDRTIEILQVMYGNNWKDKSEEYCRVIDVYNNTLSEITRIKDIGSGRNTRQIMLEIGNYLKSSQISKCGIFVDLPNGNRGMVLCKVLDFNIPTGAPFPTEITPASYVVDMPEMKMAMSEVEP